MANAVNRKVLVQMMSGHLHIEMVEVTARAWQKSDQVFFGELDKIEEDARIRMRQMQEETGQGFGPYGDIERDYDMVGVLVAVLAGLDRGRIVWMQQVPTSTIVRPDLEAIDA